MRGFKSFSRCLKKAHAFWHESFFYTLNDDEDLNPRALGKAPGEPCNPRRPAPQSRSNPSPATISSGCNGFQLHPLLFLPIRSKFTLTPLASYFSSNPAFREIIKRPVANRIHGSLTLAPSLWPDRELRKYHYSSCLSWPPREQPGSICISFIARLKKRVVAHLQVWLGTICPGTSNVLDECVFNCQGA